MPIILKLSKDRVSYCIENDTIMCPYIMAHILPKVPHHCSPVIFFSTDMIAVPDFSAGAMENWGLIIYRETSLLYDSMLSSAVNKQKIAEDVVHELAHQVSI